MPRGLRGRVTGSDGAFPAKPNRVGGLGGMQLLEFVRSRRGGELIGLVVLATGILLLLALVTYHTADSSAFHSSTNTVVANAIGYYGATMAWLFVSFFGFASL